MLIPLFWCPVNNHCRISHYCDEWTAHCFRSYTGCPAWTKVLTNLSAVPPYELEEPPIIDVFPTTISYSCLPWFISTLQRGEKQSSYPISTWVFFFFASSSKHARLGHPLTNMPTLLPCLPGDVFSGCKVPAGYPSRKKGKQAKSSTLKVPQNWRTIWGKLRWIHRRIIFHQPKISPNWDE